MESSELVEFSARQYPIDGNIIHTFGQLVAVAGPYLLTLGQNLAAVGPFFPPFIPNIFQLVGAFFTPFSAITALGLISILTGVLLVGIISTTFSEETTIDNNLSFGLFSGGVLDTISTQYEKSELAAQRLSLLESLSNNNGASGVPSVIAPATSGAVSTTCDTNFYKESDGTTCTACSCDATGSSSLQCADSTGTCTCNAGYKGTKCDATCGCDGTGSSGTACDQSTGQCTCNAGFKGTTCNTACGCDTTGSSGTACDATSGQCTCNTGYTGTTCNSCATNYYRASDGTCKSMLITVFQMPILYKCFFSACGCDATGSSNLQCADSTGQCTCNAGFKGTTCNTACGCDTTGSSGTACDASSGQCTCNTGYTGTTCNSCATNYYRKSDGTCAGIFIEGNFSDPS